MPKKTWNKWKYLHFFNNYLKFSFFYLLIVSLKYFDSLDRTLSWLPGFHKTPRWKFSLFIQTPCNTSRIKAVSKFCNRYQAVSGVSRCFATGIRRYQKFSLFFCGKIRWQLSPPSQFILRLKRYSGWKGPFFFKSRSVEVSTARYLETTQTTVCTVL